MIGSFGPVIFEVSDRRVRTFEELSFARTARYAEHEIVGRKPVTEFLGPGKGEASLSIRLDAARGLNPRNEIGRLRALCDAGTAAALVIGGQPVGGAGCTYVLVTLAEGWTRVGGHGELLAATVELTLQEYTATAPPLVTPRATTTAVPKQGTTKRAVLR